MRTELRSQVTRRLGGKPTLASRDDRWIFAKPMRNFWAGASNLPGVAQCISKSKGSLIYIALYYELLFSKALRYGTC